MYEARELFDIFGDQGCRAKPFVACTPGDDCKRACWAEASFTDALPLSDVVETSTPVPSSLFCFFLVAANRQSKRSRRHLLHGGSVGASTPNSHVVSCYAKIYEDCVTHCPSRISPFSICNSDMLGSHDDAASLLHLDCLWAPVTSSPGKRGYCSGRLRAVD